MGAAVAGAGTGAGTGAATGAMSTTRPQRQAQRVMMTLQVVRGSLPSVTTADIDDKGSGEVMDAEVWSRLPQDLIWEVLLLLPPAKLVQLQLVSRRWRQVLTCPAFRRGSMAAAAAVARDQQQQQQEPDAHGTAGVVAAIVSSSQSRKRTGGGGSGGSDANICKVVELDLFSLVPSEFWKSKYSPRCYSVVAAGDGLVCISNTRNDSDDDGSRWSSWRPDDKHGWKRWWAARYCVLHPLSRTCRVLPLLPCGFRPVVWLPPTRTGVAVCGRMTDDHVGQEVHVATFDLTRAGAATRAWGLTAYPAEPRGGRWMPPSGAPVVAALCGGETFWYRERRVHVGAPPPGRPAAALRLVEVASLAQPPPEPLLGLDGGGATLYLDGYRCAPGYAGVHLVAHRGAVFFVAGFVRALQGTDCVRVAAGVWRLSRQRLEWEPVAALHLADLVRLTGSQKWSGCAVVAGASGVRDWLCCRVKADDWARFELGFHLGTGNWELLHREEKGVVHRKLVSSLVDLRLDGFVEPARTSGHRRRASSLQKSGPLK